MGILIRGMDKPTDCGLCPFEDFGYCSVKGERNTSESGIDTDCPLIEVAGRNTESDSEIPNNCETCKHNKLEWYSEICDSCCGNNNHYEPKDEPQTERRCGNCKHLTYRWNKTWCDIKCDNPHDMVCDKWERSE